MGSRVAGGVSISVIGFTSMSKAFSQERRKRVAVECFRLRSWPPRRPDVACVMTLLLPLPPPDSSE